MKGNFGRYRRQSVLAVTGNGNGLAGFALSKSIDAKGALRKAKNRAGQQLMFLDLYNGHTSKLLPFDFYTYLFYSITFFDENIFAYIIQISIQKSIWKTL